MRKRFTTTVLALTIAVAMCVQVSAAEITLKYAELNPDGHILDNCADYFAELVAEKSDGRIEIQVYPGSELGDEISAYHSIMKGDGAIDIFRGNSITMADFGMEKSSLFGLPFIFEGRTHLWNVLDSHIGEEILKEPQDIKSGMVGLFYLDDGARNFFSVADKPIETVEDFAGLKLRAPTIMMEETIAALGARAMRFNFSELNSAFWTGVVDGADQPYSGYLSNKFYEAAPNYTLTGHTYSPSIILMSERVWNSLSKDDQNILMEAGKEVEAYNREHIEEEEAELLEEIKAAGVNVIEIEDHTPFVEATEEVIAKYTNTPKLKELYDEIRDMK